jgi:hypothetical protein
VVSFVHADGSLPFDQGRVRFRRSYHFLFAEFAPKMGGVAATLLPHGCACSGHADDAQKELEDEYHGRNRTRRGSNADATANGGSRGALHAFLKTTTEPAAEGEGAPASDGNQRGRRRSLATKRMKRRTSGTAFSMAEESRHNGRLDEQVSAGDLATAPVGGPVKRRARRRSSQSGLTGSERGILAAEFMRNGSSMPPPQ